MTTDTLTPLLTGAVWPVVAVGAVGTVVAAVWAGPTALVGAAVGLVLVIAFFSASILGLRAARHTEPTIFFVLALTIFALKVLALALVLGILQRTDLADEVVHRGALAGVVIATSLVWIAAEIRAFVRMRTPIYDLDEPSASAPGSTSEQGVNGS